MTTTVPGESIEGLWLFGYGSLIWKPPPHFDKRVPGYIEGYVRRFWQARYDAIATNFDQHLPVIRTSMSLRFADTCLCSQDHRGTPEAPGRVVTLITRQHWETLTDVHPTAPPRTWGAAYHIPPERVKEVKEYLDIREINGYSVDMAALHVPVHLPESSGALPSQEPDGDGDPASPEQDAPAPITCLVYIGLPDNPQFVGPQDPDELARHIVRSRGPSGENKEYVYNLDQALEGLRKESGVEQEVDEHVSDLARRVRAEEARMADGSAR